MRFEKLGNYIRVFDGSDVMLGTINIYTRTFEPLTTMPLTMVDLEGIFNKLKELTIQRG